MKLDVVLPKGTGMALGNSLRQTAMARLPAWRPIGIALNREHNILHATSDIPQDMYAVMASITDLTFIPKDSVEGEFLLEQFTFVGELRASSMVSEYFSLTGHDNLIISSLENNPITMTVYYRYGVGEINVSENSEFLEECGHRPKDIMVFNSRHTNVDNFTFDVKPTSLMDETLSLTIVSQSTDEHQILNDTINTLASSLSLMKKRIADKDPSYYHEA